MERRSFLSLSALGAIFIAFPALFPTRAKRGFTPLWGDGVRDDTRAMQERIDAVATLPPGTYRATRDGLQLIGGLGQPGQHVLTFPPLTYSISQPIRLR